MTAKAGERKIDNSNYRVDIKNAGDIQKRGK